MLRKKSLSELSYYIFDRHPPKTRMKYEKRIKYADFIIKRSNKENSYSGLFSPFPEEIANGIRLYTGELLKSSASIKHITGEESLRALKLLSIDEELYNKEIKTAEESMLKTLNKSEEKTNKIGWFCCGKCTVSFWRALNVGLYNRQEERLEEGMEILKEFRDSKSRWKRFPYYYTLSALSEMKPDLVEDEIKYVSAEDSFSYQIRKIQYMVGPRSRKLFIINELCEKFDIRITD